MPGNEEYPTTPVSLIAAIRTKDEGEATAALQLICTLYLNPTYGFVRQLGVGADEARDLTHDFFLGILDDGGRLIKSWDSQKGRFHSYFKACLENKLNNDRRGRRTKKRGGGVTHLSFEESEEIFSVFGPQAAGPEETFDLIQADGVLTRALLRLRSAMIEEGRGETFEKLKLSLTQEMRGKYQKLAESTGESPEGLRSAICRLRQDYRKNIELEIRQIMSADASHAEVEAELEAIKRVIMRSRL